MVVKLVPILHSCVGDLGCHATGVEKRLRIYGESFTAIQNFGWRLPRRGALPTKCEDTKVVLDTAQSFLDCAGDRGGHPTRVPVEPEHAPEGLEPEGVGQSAEQLLGTAVRDDVAGDFPREPGHALKEPCGRPARVQRQVGEPGMTGHVRAYELWRPWSSGALRRNRRRGRTRTV